jgi:thioredoxin-dependent peroxiredoxin
MFLLSLLMLIQPPPKPSDTQLPRPISQQSLVKPEGDVARLLGKTAPTFKLPNQDNQMVSLSNTKGKWLVLVFYPVDMTQGGLLQNKSYTDNKMAFVSLKANVWSISTQDVRSKKAFQNAGRLSNVLLSDVGGKTAKEYGVYNAENRLAQRVTFYIAPDGKIAYIDTSIKIKTAAIDSLNILDRLIKKEL